MVKGPRSTDHRRKKNGKKKLLILGALIALGSYAVLYHWGWGDVSPTGDLFVATWQEPEDLPKRIDPPQRQQQQQQQQHPTITATTTTQSQPTAQSRSIQHYLDLSQRQGHDKEQLLFLLRDNAGITSITEEKYHELPSWSQVTFMYGSQPRLVGLDLEDGDENQCQAFQQIVKNNNRGDGWMGIAGMFNTGTNLLANALLKNCALEPRQHNNHDNSNGAPSKQQHPEAAAGDGILWQVPYGKHNPPKDGAYRRTRSEGHLAGRNDNLMPVVIIRDPFQWMQSMCKNFYSSHWPKPFQPNDPHQRYHCPNLVPTGDERSEYQQRGWGPVRDGSFSSQEIEGPVGQSNQGVYHLLKGRIGVGNNSNKETSKPIKNTARLTQEELRDHYFPVHVVYSGFKRHYYSLVHLWNQWYQEYYQLKDQNNTQRIFVRMEDLLYFPQQVVKQVCECAGGRLVVHTNRNATDTNDQKNLNGAPVVLMAMESTKGDHGLQNVLKGQSKQLTGYLEALIRYGKPLRRFRGLTPQDLQYASHYLDANLMRMFHYNYPPPPSPDGG